MENVVWFLHVARVNREEQNKLRKKLFSKKEPAPDNAVENAAEGVEPSVC